MHIFKKVLLIISFVGLSQCLEAQTKLDLKFYPIPEGISNNKVSAIIQDRKGYMWFGTANGLNRFDGYSFKVYEPNPNDPNSISHNLITYIYEDKQENLWLATEGGGLNFFDRHLGQFVHYRKGKEPQQPSSDDISMVVEDPDGRLWLSVGNGLNAYDPKKGEFQHYLFSEEEGDQIGAGGLAIITIQDHFVWMATSSGGITRFDKRSKKFFHFTQEKGHLKENYVRTFAKSAQKNKFWIGYYTKGLALIRIEGEELIVEKEYAHDPQDPTSLSGNQIKTIYEDHLGRVWVGVENGGISLLDPKKGTFSIYKYDKNKPFSLSVDSPWSICEDRFGNVWIGTFNQGVNVVYNEYYHKFEHYYQILGGDTELANNNVNAFWEDADGSIWVGTDGGGISRWNRPNNTFKSYDSQSPPPFQLSGDAILDIEKDKNGRLWFSTWENGLNVYPPNQASFEHYSAEKNGLASNVQFSMESAKDGYLYMLSWESRLEVFDVDQNKLVWSRDFRDIDNKYAYLFHIIEDQNENLWISSANGLLLIDRANRRADGEVSVFEHQDGEANSLSNNAVNTLFEDSQGQIWVGTNEGLNRYLPESQTFEHYYKADGLASNVIRGIIEDQPGHLWISTAQGLSHFNYSENRFENFFKEDGLQGNEFARQAIYRTRGGEILIGGNNGFNVFEPSKMKKNPFPPKVYLNSFKIFNQEVQAGTKDSPLRSSIEFTKEVTLDHTQSVFTLGFVALNYTHPENNQYAYIMEGFESNWNYVGDKRSASYTSLPAGTYTFKIKSANNDGIWSKEESVLKIIVLPPWWETLWFRLLLLTSLVLIVFFGLRLRIKNIKKRNALLEKTVLERTRELEKKNTEVLLQSQELKKSNESLHQVQQEISTQNEELQQQAEELQQQRDYLEEANETIHRRLDDIKVMSEIGQQITASVKVEEIIKRIYHNVNQLIDAPNFEIGIINHRKQVVDYYGYLNKDSDLNHRKNPIDQPGSFTTWCIQHRKEVFIRDIDKEIGGYFKAEEASFHLKNKYKTLIYKPLFVGEKMIGLVLIKSFQREAYQEIHLEILRNLATSIAIALDNAQAYKTVEESHQEVKNKESILLKANQKLQKTQQDLQVQKEELEVKNRQIRQSINAALTIQEAILPHQAKLKELLGKHFVIYQPKDVVSGDFYWLSKVGEKTILIVADCTGHGVPGAFMTLIGNSILDKLVNVMGMSDPEKILQELHREVYRALKQKYTGNNYGMDAIAISVESSSEGLDKICFSGAKNSLYYISAHNKQEVLELKGSRRAIGGYQNEEVPFEYHEIELPKGSRIYLGSDGYIDQNNVKRKKIGPSKFKAFILEYTKMDLTRQKEYLEEKLQEHMQGTSQRDDILLIGFEV